MHASLDVTVDDTAWYTWHIRVLGCYYGPGECKNLLQRNKKELKKKFLHGRRGFVDETVTQKSKFPPWLSGALDFPEIFQIFMSLLGLARLVVVTEQINAVGTCSNVSKRTAPHYFFMNNSSCHTLQEGMMQMHTIGWNYAMHILWKGSSVLNLKLWMKGLWNKWIISHFWPKPWTISLTADGNTETSKTCKKFIKVQTTNSYLLTDICVYILCKYSM